MTGGSKSSTPSRLFYSYSHEDEELRDELDKHLTSLERTGVIQPWHDRRIDAGAEWEGQIDDHLEQADVILLLVSASFIASDYCYDVEMTRAIERHDAGEACVIPVILRSCDWRDAAFGKLQALPKDAKPVTSWDDKDEAFTDVTQGIRRAVQKLPQRAAQTGAQHDDLFLVPHRSNPYFAGRHSEMTQLRRSLTRKKRAALGQAISGLGGIGKTQTAVAYAYRYRDEYQVVFWVQAETSEQLTSGFVEIAQKLGLPHNRSDAAEAVQATRGWLASHEDWLLVADNADEPELVEPFLPTDVKGHVLLTSRAAVFDMLGITPLKLEVLPIDEAVTFLFERTARDRADAAELKSATELAEEVGCLPLALEQAGSYILAIGVSFARYVELYRKQPLTMLEKRGPVAAKYPQSVATTWAVNYEQLAEAQRDVLYVSAYLAPGRIPFELFAEGRAELGDAIGEALAEAGVVAELLEPLHRVSLITLDSADESYSVHRLVQEVTKDALDAESSRIWAERAIRAIDAAFPDGEFANWPLCERLLSHAMLASRVIAEHDLTSAQAARLLNGSAQYSQVRGQYTVALPLHKQALEIRRKILGEEHPHFATSCNDLASLYKSTGRYEEAEPLFKQARDIWQKVLGEEHPHFATSGNNLALLYDSTGRYEEAEPLYEQALEIRRKVLGEEHPDFATSCNNLAVLYRYTGRHEEAEPLHKQALEIRRKVLGEEHPNFAQSCNNLAELYRSTGRYEEAEPLYEQALDIRRKILGEEHPDFANSCNNLALLYYSTGRCEEAEPLYKQALEIRRNVLGEEHPSFAISCINLAGLYDSAGCYEEAEPLYKQAVEILMAAFGPNHPTIKTARANYEQFLKKRSGRE